MADAQDYRTDSEYIFHYSRLFSPRHLRAVLLLEGFDLPAREAGEPLRYLELGFGQGLSLNIHAAANDGEYWGVDFIAAHAERAGRTAAAAGSNCTILNNSFAEVDEMSRAGKLPQFDLIAFHGVLSWVDEENHAHVMNIVERTLKPGGAVYGSYNAMPGWAFFAPVRELMVSLASRYGKSSDLSAVTTEIIDYLIAFAETNESLYFGLNPRSVDYLRQLKNESPGYIAHEFLNTSWRLFYFREIAESMGKAGCKFVGSANPLHQSAVAVRPRASALMAQIINPDIREALRDFAVERKFRTDVFVRSPRKLPPDEQMERLARCGLKPAKSDSKFEVAIDFEKISLSPEVFTPLFERLNAGGRGVKPVRAVLGEPPDTAAGRQTALECLRVLLGANIASAATTTPSAAASEKCRKLNRELLREIFTEGLDGITFLASPVTGAGIRLKWEELLALHSYAENGADPEEWAQAAAKELVRLFPRESRQAALEKMRGVVNKMNGVGLAEMKAYGVLS